MISLPPSEHDLHAYVDHRLDAHDRLRLETWLASHPAEAAQVSAWQQDAQHLRAALADGLQRQANPALDPMSIRRGQRQRRYKGYASAALLVLSLGIGGMGGWQARDMTLSPTAPMTDALQAYRMFASQDFLPADYRPGSSRDLQGWLDRRFSRAERLPDLSTVGFTPTSARLMSTEQGPAAMVLYQSADGRRMTFYIRPPGEGNRLLPRGQRRDGELQAAYWSGPGYNYAVVSAASDPAASLVQQAIGI
jgi:anti-sigma factor RsiW